MTHHFDYSGKMDTNKAIDALGALAQRSRLAIFRLLVEAGPDGLTAGLIGERLDLPPATLSFHLAHLARAGLLKQQQAGRFVIYSTNFETMNALVDYLTENCCAGGCVFDVDQEIREVRTLGVGAPPIDRESLKPSKAGEAESAIRQ